EDGIRDFHVTGVQTCALPIYYEWERKGVPFRVEIGPKDLAKEQLALVRRVTPEGEKRKAFVPEVQAIDQLPSKLQAFQSELLLRSEERRVGKQCMASWWPPRT